MNAIRFQLLRGYIARLLSAATPHLFPEDQLFTNLKIIVVPEPTEPEFATVIARMEQARQILRHRTEDEGVKTKLTELGEAELLK